MTDESPPRRVDGRSSAARRFRTLVKAFTTDLGDDLSAADKALIESAAVAALRIEYLRVEMLSGKTGVDDDTLTRLLNSTTRILSIVAGKSRHRGKRELSIDEYLAAENAE